MPEISPETTPEPELGPEPTLAALMASNLKVLLGVALLITLAWGTWFLVSKLFPDVAWLQSGLLAG